MSAGPPLDPVEQLKSGRRPPCAELLGAEPLEIDKGAGVARFAFAARPEFCDADGHVQAGLLAAMLDEAMAVAAAALREFREAVPTLAMKLSHLRPVGPGRLTGEGRVLHADGALVFITGELRDAGGAACATASATARYTPMNRS